MLVTGCGFGNLPHTLLFDILGFGGLRLFRQFAMFFTKGPQFVPVAWSFWRVGPAARKCACAPLTHTPCQTLAQRARWTAVVFQHGKPLEGDCSAAMLAAVPRGAAGKSD